MPLAWSQGVGTSAMLMTMLDVILESMNGSTDGPFAPSCIKYYLIDFGLSQELNPTDNPGFLGVWGQDKTVPEMSETVPANTFKVDVYHLGNVIKKLTDVRVSHQMVRQVLTELLLPAIYGLEMLRSLAKKMTNPDPLKRLTADQAMKKFQHRKATWTAHTMERRVWQRTTPFIDRFMVKYRNFNTII